MQSPNIIVASTKRIAVISSIVAMFWAAWSVAEQPPAQAPINNQSMEARKNDFFEEFLVAKDSALKTYKKVFIDQTVVSFDEEWNRDHHREVVSSYQSTTIEHFSNILKEQLEQAFEKNENFEVVSASAPDTIVIRASITDLDIHGPEQRTMKKVYVRVAGDAVFNAVIETSDGMTLAAIKDHRETRDSAASELQRASRVSNQRDFTLLMNKWSRELADHAAMN